MIFRKLREKGVLGMNARIGNYILPHNPRKHFPRVDDKTITARLAEEHHLAMPHNYAVISRFGRLKKIQEILAPFSSFVIKPAKGAMGNGIIVITGRADSEHYIRSNGSLINVKKIRDHISEILSGLYALDGYPDKAIIQYLIQQHPCLEDLAYQGIPDIRIIVFQGFPIMAMTRLPTKKSDGRANLHQGAVGAGIDMQTGITTTAVVNNRLITHHPETGIEIRGRAIPHWDEMLLLASRCHDLSGLGYLGVDIVLDKIAGPLILELNARPGLSIQVANMKGLLAQLKKFEGVLQQALDPLEKVKLAKELLG
ncbi:MAG: alpha-L-glutamate ligase-like protein [Spirochaetae bacterium HGW-Spirochaetae-6]|nr:MAG: alpha-L-glutamate ligase-like protein [Spirochaetae bacterium HGW-Spirochaetae-6]